MTIGISRERLEELLKLSYFRVAEDREQHLLEVLINDCKELNPWLSISETPKGGDGFLAINSGRDRIEWLMDTGEAKFYNRNSNNWTSKSEWTHCRELPEDPKG